MNAMREYAVLYGPTPAEIARGMSDVGEALAGQLARLENAQDAQMALEVARNLEGAARAVMRLREALLKQEVPHGQVA